MGSALINCGVFQYFRPLYRSQEDESLRAAIALSKQDAGDEETSLHDDDDEPAANGGGNLLLDFSETGTKFTNVTYSGNFRGSNFFCR